METTQKPYAFSRKVFCEGMRDGVPIALGYFAVSFSLGIAARNAGLTPIQGFFASLFNNASAGEYAAFSLIAAGATYLEVAIITLIANARYLLMSCALAQKFAPGTPFFHRLIIGYDVTDELFGITIARPGYLNPFYTYGAITLAEGILENIDRKDKWVEGTFTAPDGTISGTTDCAPDELPISSIREGEVFGIHTVRYESDIDSISITHDAKNRGGFVLGAILAAEYTAHHEGFLGMKNLFPFLNE